MFANFTTETTDALLDTAKDFDPANPVFVSLIAVLLALIVRSGMARGISYFRKNDDILSDLAARVLTLLSNPAAKWEQYMCLNDGIKCGPVTIFQRKCGGAYLSIDGHPDPEAEITRRERKLILREAKEILDQLREEEDNATLKKENERRREAMAALDDLIAKTRYRAVSRTDEGGSERPVPFRRVPKAQTR